MRNTLPARRDRFEGVSEILRRGTGADLQRAAYERRGSLENVVDYVLETTAPV